MQGYRAIATGGVGDGVGWRGGTAIISSAVNPRVTVAGHLLVDGGGALIERHVEGDGTIATCHVGGVMYSGVVADGVGVAINPVVTVALGTGIGK